ncbi:MAG: polyhydroxyalkanoic acid system family protein [Gammaproteobacteria bacterium]|nr:polyhydroxyalkanoic acid system family protein [Gammaproteobacteria bacterium]
MATIQIRRSHQLDQQHIREQVQNLADKLASDLGVTCQWQGDRLHFERSGAKGNIQIGEGYLEFEIKLGMLLSPLKGKVEKTVTEYLDTHLA